MQSPMPESTVDRLHQITSVRSGGVKKLKKGTTVALFAIPSTILRVVVVQHHVVPCVLCDQSNLSSAMCWLSCHLDREVRLVIVCDNLRGMAKSSVLITAYLRHFRNVCRIETTSIHLTAFGVLPEDEIGR